MPKVYGRLAKADGVAAKAARFTILTAVRAGETTGATWPAIDRKAGIWSISASRMKMDRDHPVPLSREALAILSELYETRTDDRVFPGQRAGRPLSLRGISKAEGRGGREGHHARLPVDLQGLVGRAHQLPA
ncbi:MAG: tyrosine-type recombinase/integrase [Planctomycetota bacterium]